ncbi:RNA 2',3'-cyclic phosphodiesterase [Myxococcus sp. K15C18031901]|uniref:RNA 2',3'-cyclic phosphodiesterase n=1 Tax=Myxococcus dinghuensis TaxID=2906761 RepID=UPI0020A80065|nr:RNA 2',3'-cyclic phosphodiesterase [Myxococcus dinghuensis]MCP3100662.1 RNA 2',3'-cyclic phosphodiesterase [Myxococcus dinghuensis]
MRLFTAVTLGRDIETRVTQELVRLRELAPRARWVRVEGLHLTLLFLGEVDRARLAELRAALLPLGTRHAPFTLSVGGGGSFGQPAHPRVLWADVRGDIAALKALQADTAAALLPLGFKSDYEDYAPHLTLARGKEHGDADLVQCVEALAGSTLGEGRVDRLILFESQGAHYVPRVEVPLTRAP